jgi:hypothetical protein
MKSAPHPPYSPDLAPSDFYLFAYVKKCLAGLSFEDADQLLAAVEGILEGIEKMTLQAVFLEWMDGLRKCIATNGEYTEEAQIKVIEEWSFILPILRCLCPGGTPCTLRFGFWYFNDAPSMYNSIDPDFVRFRYMTHKTLQVHCYLWSEKVRSGMQPNWLISGLSALADQPSIGRHRIACLSTATQLS